MKGHVEKRCQGSLEMLFKLTETSVMLGSFNMPSSFPGPFPCSLRLTPPKHPGLILSLVPRVIESTYPWPFLHEGLSDKYTIFTLIPPTNQPPLA